MRVNGLLARKKRPSPGRAARPPVLPYHHRQHAQRARRARGGWGGVGGRIAAARAVPPRRDKTPHTKTGDAAPPAGPWGGVVVWG